MTCQREDLILESYFANPSAPLIRALAVEVKELGKADRIQKLMEQQGCLAWHHEFFITFFGLSVSVVGRCFVELKVWRPVEVWCSVGVLSQRCVKYGLSSR